MSEKRRADPVVQLCAFAVGSEQYVLDLMRVSEIVLPQRVTAVPRAPEFVEGVVNLRGAIIPVVDLRKRLGVPATQTRKTRLIICTVGGRRVGLLADAVTEVLRIPRSEIRPVPDLLATSGRRYFLGVCGKPGALKLLLDARALLESDAPLPSPQQRAAALSR